LGFWEKKGLFPNSDIRLFYPHLAVNERNRGVIGFLVSRMTQGFTDAQREKFEEALEKLDLTREEGLPILEFLEALREKLDELPSPRHTGTLPAIKRGLRFVSNQMETMNRANELLRERMKGLPFEPMPDPLTAPDKFVSPGQMSIIYLGGYDHLTQSTIVSLVIKNLFDARASMRNSIPPFLSVVEEAHNFIPSRGEGQAETPSVDIIRKVITEGRKFGVGLLLISQRPSRLDETTLSQCNSFLIFRLVNPRDQSFVEKVMENLTKADSRLLPGFGPGQGIVSGQAVRFPVIVKVDFDEDLITTRIGDEDFVQAVNSWEKSPEGEAARRGAELDEKLDEIAPE
jgi:DNA helicase HerA-like ATPase